MSVRRRLLYLAGRAAQRVAAVDFRMPFGRGSRVVVRDPPGGVHAFARGYPGLPDVSLLLREVRPDDVVADVGANIGLYSLALWDHEPTIRVHAFEPTSGAFEWLVANRRCNDAPWRCIKVAVGAREGLVRVTQGLGGFNHVVADGTATADGEVCPVVTLDAYAAAAGIGEIGLLKVDVEGYEVPVLQGAAALLRARRIRFLLLENDGHQRRYGFGPGDYEALLRPHGYVRVDDRSGNFEAWRRA